VPRVVVLQHIACEPPGVYEDVLRERGAEIRRVELDRGDGLPDWRDFDAVVAMGGPMAAYDDGLLPWLGPEKRLIGGAVRAGVPFWGACLGAQLLAASLGARVYPGPRPEIGLLSVDLTAEAAADPVFAGLPRVLPTFQWHGDTFDLPDGAVRLARSAAYPNQAFRWGRSAYGLQFHLEVSPDLASEWARVPAYAAALEHALGPGAALGVLADLGTQAQGLRALGRQAFERWWDHAGLAAAGRP
jgi:GMP synthase (glutamine-hydrolysing)